MSIIDEGNKIRCIVRFYIFIKLYLIFIIGYKVN